MKHRGHINYSSSLSHSFVQCDLQFHSDSFVPKPNISHSLTHALSEPGWMWWFPCLRINSLKGVGRDRRAKERRGEWVWGWGLTGVSVGTWGWATVEHPPRYCLLCQAESVFLQEVGLICHPQQTLSVFLTSSPINITSLL